MKNAISGQKTKINSASEALSLGTSKLKEFDPQNFHYQDQGRVYLDHNATTPLARFAKLQFQAWLEAWGNPSSIHKTGRGPKAILRGARTSFISLIGAGHPLELVFTSGGSEANNLAIKGVFDRIQKSRRRELIITAVEHPSVENVAQFLELYRAVKVHRIPVSREGILDWEFLEHHINDQTALVSVMYANNETGNIFPIKKIVKLAKEHGALVHCDAVQALGKAVVDVKAWGVDLASFSGHKFYALKGCGALYIKRGVELEPLIHGGSQERKRRAGTENLLAVAALGAMAEWAPAVETRVGEMKRLRDGLEKSILTEIEDVRVTGGEGRRLTSCLSLVIAGVDGESLLMSLDLKGFSVSTGAACSSGSPEPSPVLIKMGLSREEAQSSLRLSLGWGTTEIMLEEFVKELKLIVVRLRGLRGQS